MYQYEMTKSYLKIMLLLHVVLVCIPLQIFLSSESPGLRSGCCWVILLGMTLSVFHPLTKAKAMGVHTLNSKNMVNISCCLVYLPYFVL